MVNACVIEDTPIMVYCKCKLKNQSWLLFLLFVKLLEHEVDHKLSINGERNSEILVLYSNLTKAALTVIWKDFFSILLVIKMLLATQCSY